MATILERLESGKVSRKIGRYGVGCPLKRQCESAGVESELAEVGSETMEIWVNLG